MTRRSFIQELRKRGVLQSAAIYGAVAWGVTEIVVTVVEQLFLPQWVSTLTVIVFVVGFPVAMFLAWTFDFTARGIRRTEVSSRRGTASIVFSMLLLVAGTTGLFFLIRPELQQRELAAVPVKILPNSVVVLPFENAGLDPRDAYLGEGLSDALRDQLGRVSGVRVAARSSSLAALERQLDALEISEKLRVASIVEGSVRRQGGVLRVSVQLVEGHSGLAAWTETYERAPSELLLVQQSIAEAIVALLLPESSDAVAEPATWDPTANELMMVARSYERRVRAREDVDVELLLKAVQLYREATAADPESALAHSRLALTLVWLGDLEAAEAPINKALTINPNLSEVQHTLGVFRWAGGLVNEARLAWKRAVELNPNNPEALQDYARSQWYQINYGDVEETLRRAVQLDPLNLEPYGTLGAFQAMVGDPRKAYELVEEVEELFDGAAAFRVIAQLLAYLGDVDQAIAWTIRARDLEPRNSAHVDRLAEYYADIGATEAALMLAPDHVGILFKMRRYDAMIPLAELAMIDEPQDLRLRSILAIAYNAVQQYESAVHVLTVSGLPDLVYGGWRTQAEWDGLIALMNAYYGAGSIEASRELAQFAVDFGVMKPTEHWWWISSIACAQAILERDGEVRELLELMQEGADLPWSPILKDSPCFERFSDDPVYKATVRYFDERRAMLRERLPPTLAEFGVEL